MNRSFVFTRAVLAVVGLLLVGPQKASADQVFACVSNIGNIFIVAANATCPSGFIKISWNATTSGGMPGPTDLLFPYVVNTNGFDTGLAISNTSADPYNTTTQSGTCTLNIYTTGTTPFTYTTPTVAPGTTWAGLLSVIDPGAAGYIFATCTFTYAHRFAFISDVGARNLAMGYLATVVQTPRPNNENLNN